MKVIILFKWNTANLSKSGRVSSPAHFSKVVKGPPKHVMGSFSFSGVGSLIPIKGMMNLYEYTDVIERK